MTAYLNGKPVSAFYLDGERFSKSDQRIDLKLKKDISYISASDDSYSQKIAAGTIVHLWGPFSNSPWQYVYGGNTPVYLDCPGISYEKNDRGEGWRDFDANRSIEVFRASDIEAQIGGGS